MGWAKWLMSIIPATLDAETGRGYQFETSTGKKLETLISTN
jgi:hypothetical protein